MVGLDCYPFIQLFISYAAVSCEYTQITELNA